MIRYSLRQIITAVTCIEIYIITHKNQLFYEKSTSKFTSIIKIYLLGNYLTRQ